VHGAEIERVEEFGELVDVVLPAELVLDAGFDGRPVVAEARRDAAVVGRQRRELRIPVAVIAERTMNEHHRRAAALLDIRQADARRQRCKLQVRIREHRRLDSHVHD